MLRNLDGDYDVAFGYFVADRVAELLRLLPASLLLLVALRAKAFVRGVTISKRQLLYCLFSVEVEADFFECTCP